VRPRRRTAIECFAGLEQVVLGVDALFVLPRATRTRQVKGRHFEDLQPPATEFAVQGPVIDALQAIEQPRELNVPAGRRDVARVERLDALDAERDRATSDAATV
jgi:hypothetical protein